MEIGLKLLRTSGSSVGFLSSGLITAVLKEAGTTPVDNEELIIVRTGGPNIGKSSLMSLAGRGSNRQEVGLEESTNLESASNEIVSK